MPLIGFLFVLNGLLHNIKTPQGMLVISAGMYKETSGRQLFKDNAVLGGIVLAPILGLAGIIRFNIFKYLSGYRLNVFIPKFESTCQKTFYGIIRIFTCIFVIWVPFFC